MSTSRRYQIKWSINVDGIVSTFGGPYEHFTAYVADMREVIGLTAALQGNSRVYATTVYDCDNPSIVHGHEWRRSNA